MNNESVKKAILYRMVLEGHVCPYGIKAKALLQAQGYEVQDNCLTSREAVDAFKKKHGVETTPQTFINGKRMGGYDDLRLFFEKKTPALNYKPILALFMVTALMALATSFGCTGSLFTRGTLTWFISFSMSILALLKLQNLEGFSTLFLHYDLLARRWVPYAYIYPFAEALAGILMISQALNWISIPVALFIGTIGAISVFKAVYLDKRDLKCACLGGDSNVPLGFISLTENVMMLGMALFMLLM